MKLPTPFINSFLEKKGIASSHILYTVRNRQGENAKDWKTDIWESDYDGANAHQVTKEGVLCVTPTYLPTPGGKHPHHFLYVSYKIGQPKIFASSLKEAESKRVSFMKGNQLMPVFSPQGDQLAFVSDASGNPEIYVQAFHFEKGLTGQPHQVFASPHGAQASPTFSPDGKKIAFVSNKDGAPRIYSVMIPPRGISPLSVKPTILSKQNKDNTCPAWSPDGAYIAYSSLTKGVRQIWLYEMKTGKEIQLTTGSGHKENPCWASNSTHLVFNSSTSNSSELYLINLHQKEAVKISQGSGEKRFPSWEP